MRCQQQRPMQWQRNHNMLFNRSRRATPFRLLCVFREPLTDLPKITLSKVAVFMKSVKLTRVFGVLLRLHGVRFFQGLDTSLYWAMSVFAFLLLTSSLENSFLTLVQAKS